MQKEPRIAIIGAGIAGLSAGIYARMNGFEAHIFERNSQCGGVCQSWQRNGYTVNGSIHWLLGSAPGSEFYEMWRELGVIEDTAFFHHGRFLEYEAAGGRRFSFFTDAYKMRQALLEWAPEDKAPIEELFQAILTIAAHPLPLPRAGMKNRMLTLAKTLFTEFPLIRSMVHWQPLTVGEFSMRFQNPHIRKMFASLWHSEISMAFLLVQLAYAHLGSASYPLGGSGAFIEKLQNRFLDLSGHLHLGTGVQKIKVENGKARSVVLDYDLEVNADYFISAADGHHTLFQLLGEQYLSSSQTEAFSRLEPFPGLLYFSAGIRRDFSEIPNSILGYSMPLRNPVTVGRDVLDRVTFQIYNFDSGLCSEGKTLITALIPSTYSFWKAKWDQGEEAYKAAREGISKALLDNLNLRFPGLLEQVDFADLATPVTYERETGNYRGSYEGWLPTPASLRLSVPQQVKNVSNLWLAGHWVSPGGGMPPAAFTGRKAVEEICIQSGKEFETQTW